MICGMPRTWRLRLTVLLVPTVAGGGPNAQTSPAPPLAPPTMALEPLRDAASAANKLVGTAVQSAFLNDPRYSAVFSRHFNYVTAEYEMKWDPIERSPGAEDFSGGDRIASYAESQGMRIKGHALVWHQAVPGWVGRLSASDLRTAFENHIRSAATHYRGRVLAWDVVNEAVADDGSGLRDT